MTDRSQIDDGWGELLGDEPPSTPTASPGSGSVTPSAADVVPPPPTFTPLLSDSRRGDSMVESMHSLMKADSGAAAEATAHASAIAPEAASDPAEESDPSARLDVASASGSMPKLWEALWTETEPPASSAEAREEDSFAALLPRPPSVQAPERAAGSDESGVGLRLAQSLEPEAPARIGPDTRRTSAPAIEQSVELLRPPRVAEEVAVRPGEARDDEREVDDVPVRPSVAARVAEEAPARQRAAARVRATGSSSYPTIDEGAANGRQRAVWIGGAALLATAAIIGIAMRGGDGSPSTSAAKADAAAASPSRQPAQAPETAAHAAAAEVKAPPARAETADDSPPSADDRDAPPPEVRPPDEPPPAVPPEPEPEPPTPEPAAPTEPAAGLSPGAPGAYDAAKAEYEGSGSQDALATMVKAACAMSDGPSARSAFRKLKPTELRKDALSACIDAKIDPTLSIEGPTPEELVQRARRELDAGDAAAAMETARESNRMKRSSDALLVMMLAACAQSDAEEARRLRKHVARDDRAQADEACTARGIDASTPPK